jgi:hypothetical protein
MDKDDQMTMNAICRAKQPKTHQTRHNQMRGIEFQNGWGQNMDECNKFIKHSVPKQVSTMDQIRARERVYRYMSDF